MRLWIHVFIERVGESFFRIGPGIILGPILLMKSACNLLPSLQHSFIGWLKRGWLLHPGTVFDVVILGRAFAEQVSPFGTLKVGDLIDGGGDCVEPVVDNKVVWVSDGSCAQVQDLGSACEVIGGHADEHSAFTLGLEVRELLAIGDALVEEIGR